LPAFFSHVQLLIKSAYYLKKMLNLMAVPLQRGNAYRQKDIASFYH